MTEHADKPSARIELDPALPKHTPILANLLELYAHDFSEFHNLEIGADGRFGYKSLSLYWTEPDRHPFLIRVDGKLAGLALVKRGSEISGNQTVWDMAEFFVLRGCRRRGSGTLAAQAVWRGFPGPWEVRVMQSNVLARLFCKQPLNSDNAEPIITAVPGCRQVAKFRAARRNRPPSSFIPMEPSTWSSRLVEPTIDDAGLTIRGIATNPRSPVGLKWPGFTSPL
jgi:predicted acetyltransferase